MLVVKMITKSDREVEVVFAPIAGHYLFDILMIRIGEQHYRFMVREIILKTERTKFKLVVPRTNKAKMFVCKLREIFGNDVKIEVIGRLEHDVYCKCSKDEKMRDVKFYFTNRSDFNVDFVDKDDIPECFTGRDNGVELMENVLRCN